MKSVIIIEDNEHLLQSFINTVNSSNKYTCLQGFTSFEAALEFCKITQPDLALVDIKLPGMNGIKGIQELQKINSSILSIIISVYDNSDYIFQALSAGAIGYLTKNCKPNELLRAFDEAISGGAPMSSTIARKIVSFFQIPNKEELSKRENEVLQILATGKSYATIASELNVSINTIKTHTRNIYEKLHINNRKELLKKYRYKI